MLVQQLSKIGSPLICPAAVVVKAEKVLLGLRHYTPDKWKDISVWTTPGGRCNKGETLEQTLRREVQEEVGITDLQILDFIGEISGGKEGDIVPTFYCTTNQNFTLMEPDKFSEWRWVPLNEYKKGEPWSTMNPPGHKMIVEYLDKKFLSSGI